MARWLCGWVLAALWAAPVVAAETVEARLNWADLTTLGVPVSGVIAEVAVRAGQAVAAGDELLRLDDEPFAARTAAAAAELERLRPARDEALAEMERATDLLDRTVIADAEFRAAEIARQETDASFRGAEARLRHALWRQRMSVLRAPLAARILEVRAAAGQAVANLQRVEPLLTLAAADALLAEAGLSGERAARLRLGQPIPVRLGRQRLNGTVEAIEYRADAPAPSRYLLRVRFAVSAATLPDLDQNVQIELP